MSIVTLFFVFFKIRKKLIYVVIFSLVRKRERRGYVTKIKNKNTHDDFLMARGRFELGFLLFNQ